MNIPVRVLYVDDSPSDRALVRDALESDIGGFIVTEADSREKFEARLCEEPFDIVLTDFNILGYDGLQVLDAVRARCGDVPVIVVTGTGSEEVGVEAMKRGAADYVIKTPSHIRRLPSTIYSVLEKARLMAERSVTEQAVRQSEKRLRDLIDGLGPSMFVGLLTPDGILVEANRSGLASAGLQAEDVLGRPFEETYWWAYSTEIQQQLRDAIARAAHGQSSRYDVQLRAAENRMITVDFSLQSLRDDAGTVIFLVPSAIVITERKQAEEHLRASEARFRQLAENIREVFWVRDQSGHAITYISPAYEDIWGRTCESLYASPRDWIASVHQEDRERVAHSTANLQFVGTYDEEYRIVRPDGSERQIHDRAFPVRDAAGNIERIVGVAQDNTTRNEAEAERRRLEDQLRQSQKMEAIGQLAGGVAHDFNNLLTVICGTAEFALDRIAADDPIRTEISEILLAGARASSLTQQLLAFSRKQMLRLEVLNLNTIITEMKGMLQRLIGEHIELSIILKSGLGNIRADTGQIQQVILNLVVNARDAMHDGGALSIETRECDVYDGRADQPVELKPGRYVVLAITDSGAGISEAMRARIFEPFFTTKASGQGTGLGLSMVYGIVKQSEGGIAVKSEPSHGTTFEIYLPFEPAAVQAVQPTHSETTSKGTETILLVEDDEPLRHLVTRILVASGYAVLAAGSGDEALARVKAHSGPIDLLLTDVILPGFSGRDLAERLGRDRPGIPVLYSSGYADDMTLRLSVRDRNAYFIGKPYAPKELTKKVREVLDA